MTGPGLPFVKAHGLGNDFLLVEENAGGDPGPALARALCDRHRGVGADGLIVFSKDPPRMRLFNADGSEAEISGNGLRCLAALLVLRGSAPDHHTIETAAGPRAVEVSRLSPNRFSILSDLGAPILESREIPADLPVPRVVDFPLTVLGEEVRITATSLGNPHCAVFVPEPVSDERLRSLGSVLEVHPAFPRRTNVEFVTMLSPRSLRVRLWERGVGYTQASGTGSASALVAAVLTGRAGREADVLCDGGTLRVSWLEGEPVRQTAEAEVLFEGEWLAPPPPA